MRHLFAILLTFGSFGKVFSDVGNCVKYEVDIKLTDDTNVRGFVYAVGYEVKLEFNDVTFLDYIKRNYPDTLKVFRNVRRLKYPKLTRAPGECETLFDAVAPEDLLKILTKKIKSIKLINIGSCHNCDVVNGKIQYGSNGIYPTVITELTKAEIDLLQTNPLATVGFGHNLDDNTTYWMMSYDEHYNQTQLERLRDEFLEETDKLLKENNWDKVQTRYRSVKSELRKAKIVVFKMEFAL